MIDARRRGFSMLEAIVTVALTVIFTAAFTELVVYSSRSSRANLMNAEALTYLQNEVEVARDLAQSDWAALSDPSCAAPDVCHPVASGTVWTFASGTESIGGGVFTRGLTIAPVARSSSAFPNTIVASGTANGVVDPLTKQVIAEVSWTDGIMTRTSTVQTYVYDLPN